MKPFNLKERVELFERSIVLEAFAACNFNIAKAAKAVGLTRTGFYCKLKRLVPDFKQLTTEGKDNHAKRQLDTDSY